MADIKALLAKLGIEDVNAGASTGHDWWVRDDEAGRVVSINPSTGEPIASVVLASENTCDRVVAASVEAFRKWREVPAPKRGELVRDLGNALREMKGPLGELVSLEMGKIRAEGLGEVQEMIDICDFAVGLSRQLYERSPGIYGSAMAPCTDPILRPRAI
jgi:aldehyde dehydrogenase (NAD+)